MTTRVGINGFGRIGRQSLKALIERAPDVEVVAVNDLVDAKMNALLFKRDSTYGTYPGEVEAGDSSIIIDGREIKILAEKDPGGAAVGRPRRRHRAREHGPLHRTPRRPRPTSPPAPRRSSSAPRPRARTSPSCSASTRTATTRRPTTSSATPAAPRTAWPRRPRSSTTWSTIERGLMNTIHSYTNDQRILDVAHKDPRRARSAGQNIIPTTTGAAKALALVIPDLKGKFDGFSLRVPDADRERRRLHRDRQPADLQGGAQRRLPGRGRRPDEGHPRRVRRAARVDGLQGRQPQLDHRRRVDDGPGRHDGQGHRLVRQRVGLQLPGRRPDRVRAARLPVAV